MRDVIHLRASGVSLVLDLSGGRLPRIVHWGADLGSLRDDALADLTLAGRAGFCFGGIDDQHPVSILPEHTYGWLGTPGLDGSRAGRHHSTRFAVTDVAETSSAVRVSASDADADLDLVIEIEVLASGLMRARASLTSTGNGSWGDQEVPYELAALQPMLPVPPEAQELLDFTGRWIKERTPQRTPFTVGTRLRESRAGKPDHDSAFAMVAGEGGFGFGRGEVWLTHVAWSGNIRTLAERSRFGDAYIGGGELLLPGEVRLAVGDTYTSPWIYGAYGAQGLDEASARIHRWMRARPEHPHRPRPVTVNTWEAVYFDHDHHRLRALADAAAAVGAERFVLDDGWFRHRRADDAGLGDWYVDEGVYPEGLGFLADHVRSLGLEFGIWVEPEMVNPDSDLARNHPEWVAQPGLHGGRWPIEARRQQVLDLTHPEAYAYIEERLHAVVAELRPAYLKWDHNRVLVEAGSSAHGRAIAHEQTLAFYRLVDGLKAAFPGLEIESCSGGGARIDLEALQHTDRVWASDTNDPLERQSIQRWTQLLVPPELIGAHMGPPRAHTTHRDARLTFRGATAIFGHLGIEWDVTSDDAVAARDEIAGWVALHRRLRALLHTGTVVNSDLPETQYAIHGVVSADLDEAVFSIASLGLPLTGEVGLVRLGGLDPDTAYEVAPIAPPGAGDAPGRALPRWWPGPVSLTGRVLARHGLQVPALPPEDAVLLHATAVSGDTA